MRLVNPPILVEFQTYGKGHVRDKGQNSPAENRLTNKFWFGDKSNSEAYHEDQGSPLSPAHLSRIPQCMDEETWRDVVPIRGEERARRFRNQP